jgi:hypothetical protein
MSNHDEELQRKTEAGIFDDENDLDAASYKMVFKALSKQSEVKLSEHFSDSVITKIQARQKRTALRDFLWLLLGVTFLVVGFVIAFVVSGLQFEFGFLKQISSYSGVFIFGAIVIVIFNWVEKRLLHLREDKI